MILQQSEWILMEKLWDESPRTLMQLCHSLEENPGWTKSTVNTMLKRMMKKGIVRCEEGKTRRYYPCVERVEASISETAHLLDKLYHGSVSMMMSTLVKNQRLSRKEVRELHEILDSMDDTE